MLFFFLTTAFGSQLEMDLDLDIDVSANVRVAEVVHVDRKTDGNLYTLGEALIVDAPVEGHVGGLAKNIRVTRTGRVGGNLTLAGETLVLAGPVAGDVTGAMRVLDLNSRVEGSMKVALQDAKLGPRARIDGDLDYESEQRIPALEKVVRGTVTWEQADVEIEFE